MSEPLYVTEMFSSIQGEGMLVGRRQIFVRLPGCNLDCRYCDTDYEISDICRVETRPGSGSYINLPQPMSLKKIFATIIDWIAELPKAHHSVSFTGGEPLLHAAALAKWLPEIRKVLPVHLETNGTIPVALKIVKPHLDYISMDIKLPSTSGCDEKLWDLHAAFLREAYGNNLSVKVVIGDSTSISEISRVCDIITSVDRSLPLFMQPLTLAGGTAGISAARILNLQAKASSILPDVRVIPQTHRMLGLL